MEKSNTALKFSLADNSGTFKVNQDGTAQIGTYANFEFSFYTEDLKSIIHIIANNGAGSYWGSSFFHVENGKIHLNYFNGNGTLVGEYEAGKWYHAVLSMNTTNGTYKFYLNNDLKKDKIE